MIFEELSILDRLKPLLRALKYGWLRWSAEQRAYWIGDREQTKPALNQWWGVDYAKWRALKRDGTAAGYYASEVHYLEDHLSKGAYEWLVTLGEIERWREPLGENLKELTYDALTTAPKSTLKGLCEFFEIDSPPSWLDEAVSAIGLPRHNKGPAVRLPPAMCEEFNRYQERYGFPNRALCLEENRCICNQTWES